MRDSQCYIGTPNGVVLCVDRADKTCISGRYYHSYSSRPGYFSNIDDLVFQLEDFFDRIGFPRRTTNGRTFQGARTGSISEQAREKQMKDEELLKKHGDMGSFIVRVQHRQNSSWQGRITWMEENRTIYFRSIWEMIRLIESALDAAGIEGEEMPQISWEDAE